MRRTARAIIVIAVVVLATTHGRVAAGTTCWSPPVVGVVTDPFREPPCPYCAGNRGLEYSVGKDVSVWAVASGTVSWAGEIGGIRYVVVRHRDGWRTTYGRLVSTQHSTGDVVLAGMQIGRASGDFYFGLRVGSDYVDPAPFIGRLVHRPRLIPIDATSMRPARPAVLRCRIGR